MKKPFSEKGLKFPVNLVNSTLRSIFSQIVFHKYISGAQLDLETALSQSSVTTAQGGCQLYFKGEIDSVDKNHPVHSDRVRGCRCSNSDEALICEALSLRFGLPTLAVVRIHPQISCCKEDHTIIDMCLFTAGTFHPHANQLFTDV